MNTTFVLKVKKKRLYAPGALVIGNIVSGNISCDEIVIVRVNSKEYKAYVDAINNNYPNGHSVHSCSTGSNVGLYLSKVDYDDIKLGKTVVERIAIGDDETIETKQKKDGIKNKTKGKKQKKLEKAKEDDRIVDSSAISQSAKKSCNPIVESENPSHTESKSYATHSRASIKAPLQLNSQEKEFIEDIKVCMKDGGRISPSEFFVLDKIRKALSISQEQAKSLIAFVYRSFNDKQNEIEYSDAVSMCLMDSNYITTTERFLLEKLRLSLNITQQRAYEIEENCKWILTE